MAIALPLLLGQLLGGSEGTKDDGRNGVRARPRDVARHAPPWHPPRRGAASSGWSRHKARCSCRRRLPLIPQRAVWILGDVLQVVCACLDQ